MGGSVSFENHFDDIKIYISFYTLLIFSDIFIHYRKIACLQHKKGDLIIKILIIPNALLSARALGV